MIETLHLTLMDVATFALPVWTVAGLTGGVLLLVAGWTEGPVETRLMLGGYLLVLMAMVLALPLLPLAPLPLTLTALWAGWILYRITDVLAGANLRQLFSEPLMS